MEPLLNIAVTAATNASNIIMSHWQHRHSLTISQKASKELFSEVDLKAENAIIQCIKKYYPNHGIIAEESGIKQEDAEVVWIIDPLDGTQNYLHGFPFFAVSIAISIKNRIEHGVIFDPLHHECFTASRGRGARLNNTRIRVSSCTKLEEALLSAGFSFSNQEQIELYLKTFNNLFNNCGSIRRCGSAAIDLAYTACGRLDGYWELGLRPWDIAAGILLVQEAGGFISELDGQEAKANSKSLVAANPKIYKQLLKALTA